MKIIILGFLFVSVGCLAELKNMSDMELSTTTGDGLGFALQDFAFSTEDANVTLTGIENSNNEEILVQWFSKTLI